MTVRELVKTLQNQGHRVTYYERKDGGILITSIDGVRYKGALGNKIARFMTSQTLSEKRGRQLQRITYSGKRKRKRLPEDDAVKRELLKTQRIWNKKFPHKRGETPDVGLITSKKVQWNLEHKGKEETLRLLKEAQRYAKGIAYTENVEQLIEYIKDLFPDIADWLREHIDEIREDKMEKAYQILYLLNNGVSREQVHQLLQQHFGIIK